MLNLESGKCYVRHDGQHTGPLERGLDGRYFRDPKTGRMYWALCDTRLHPNPGPWALIREVGAPFDIPRNFGIPPEFADGGLYRHSSGHLGYYRGRDQFQLVGNGPLGYDGNHAQGLPGWDPTRLDIPKEAVNVLKLEVGKTYETYNGSQVCVIAKHDDGEFEVTVLKGGHNCGQDLRGHGPGSSYIVRADGTPRPYSSLSGGTVLAATQLTVVKLGKPFRADSPIAEAIATEFARIHAERAR